ncbi:hypothetical protein FNT36_20645 [Hymenobacter setariae]|uniref:Uncharacterized protein n=1 Tax=Hymenobacter setariae TaxID=2594794 RepID=A0A558BQ23_9BACT|nr:hypothetical protein [Hymenobacter setariae]TVT38592.1 hypothetical protein FNT36_20645 [Hymenobacter setariae]
MATRIGVVIGRFQVPRLALHPGYRALLAHVAHENNVVLVVLGEAPQPDQRNPLSFGHRQAMFAEEYPAFRVLPLPDEPSDAEWVRHLDTLIESNLGPVAATVQLYGGRGSFLDTYQRYGGQFATTFLPDLTSPHHCATDIRRRIGQEQRSSADIRTGLIQAWEGRGASTVLSQLAPCH